MNYTHQHRDGGTTNPADSVCSIPPGSFEQLVRRTVADTDEDAVVAIDTEMRVRYLNAAAGRQYGVDPDAVVGSPLSDLFVAVWEDPGEPQRAVAMLQTSGVWRGRKLHVLHDGQVVHVDVTARVLRTRNGRLIGYVGIERDRTSEVTLLAELRRERDWVRHLLDNADVMIVVLDTTWKVRMINQAGASLLGHAQDRIVGRDWIEEFVPVERRDRVRAYFYDICNGGIDRRRIADGEVVAAGGTRRAIEWHIAAITGADGRVFEILGSGIDITERRDLQREVVHVSELERERFGRDLHDGLGSHLSGLAMLSRSLADDRRCGLAVSAEDLDEIARLAAEGAEQARMIAHGVSPVHLTGEGFAASLAELAVATSRRAHVQCAATVDAEATSRLSSRVATQLYLIAREAVSNATRHSGCSHITIQFDVSEPNCTLNVRDDGMWNGCEPPEHAGLGINTMRYRAQMVGGRLEIDRDTNGTTVTCELPHTNAVAGP